MLKNQIIVGILFALMAALLNATIGIISSLLISSGLEVEQIAFLKTIVAYFLISIFLIRIPIKNQQNKVNHTKKSANLFIEIAFCSFLGIFTLFFFETIAYDYGSPPNVVIILMASATISALLFGSLILKEKISFHSACGSLLAIIGISIISGRGDVSFSLLFNAGIAGTGYGLFTIFVRKFKLNGGIFLTKYLLMFGSIFLFFPMYFKSNINFIDKIDLNVSFAIIALALFPTILGFYCTTKALKYINASKVQVIELSEPIFSSLLTIIFLKIIPNLSFFIGSLFIILGIICINDVFKRKSV